MNNKIQFIQDEAFSKLPSVTFIDLGTNEITNLTSKSLSGATKLEYVTLDNNNLSRDIRVADFPQLKNLSTIQMDLIEKEATQEPVGVY